MSNKLQLVVRSGKLNAEQSKFVGQFITAKSDKLQLVGRVGENSTAEQSKFVSSSLRKMSDKLQLVVRLGKLNR